MSLSGSLHGSHPWATGVLFALSALFVMSTPIAAQLTAPRNVRLVPTGSAPPPTPISGVEIFPGQSIQTVVNSHAAGTTFVLKAGVHRMQTITPRTGDRFVGEMSGSTRLTTLSGGRVLSGWVSDGARWYVTGQTQGGAPEIPSADVCRPSHPRCSFSEDLFVDNVLKYHEDVLSEVGPGEWFFDYGTDRIYVGDNPSGRVVETSVTRFVFNQSSADNVTVENLIIEKYATPTGSSAVNLGYSPGGAENWSIKGSEVRWNHGGGIGMDTRTSAINNYVHHNCGFGFVGAGTDLVVENNHISYNNVMAGSETATCGYDSYWGAGGSKWVWTANLIVRGNFSHHNDGPGLWTDINNIYTLYENNIIEDNKRGGIFHEISYDAVIRNNAIRRNGSAKDYPWWTTGAGIEVVSSRNVEVTGNTLVDNWQGITGLNDHRGSGNLGPYTLINLNVHDNHITSRITDGGGGRTGVVETVGTEAFQAAANNRFVRNTYVLGSTARYFMWTNNDLTEHEWQSYGQDIGGSFQR